MWQGQCISIYHDFGREEKAVVAAVDPNASPPRLIERSIPYFSCKSTKHIFLVKNDSHFGRVHNPWSVQLLLSWLQQSFTDKTFHPIQSVKRVLDKLVPLYLTNIKGLEFNTNTVTPILEDPSKEVQLAHWEMDSRQGFIFSLNDNTEYVPKYIVGEEDTEEGLNYIVQIELPGVVDQDVRIRGDMSMSSFMVFGERKSPWKTNARFYSTTTFFGKFSLTLKIPAQYSVLKGDVIHIMENGLYLLKFPTRKSDW